MPVDRHFCTWDRPFLPQLADWLLQRAGRTAGCHDLSDTLVVLPVAAASRRLTELLLDATDGRLFPPALLTPADFPERLYRLKQPLATPHTQRVAWMKAIRSQPPQQLARLLPSPPSEDATREWLGLAELLQTQHRELARDDLDFGQVARQLREIEGDHEYDRWDLLAEIEMAYLDSLDSVGLWDRQAARLFAVDHDECRTECRIVLAAMSDLNLIVRRMVLQAAGAGERKSASSELPAPCAEVAAVIHANAEAADLFDEIGVLDADAWAKCPLTIPEDAFRLAEDGDDQAEIAGLELAVSGRFAPQEIAIGCPNDRIVDQIVHRLDEAGVEAVRGVGRRVADLAPVQVLRLLARHIEQPTPRTLAQLCQHPAIAAALPFVEDDVEADEPSRVDSSSVLRELDAYRLKHYPRVITADGLAAAHQYEIERERPGYPSALLAVRYLEQLLDPVGQSPQAMRTAVEQVMSLVDTLFPNATGDVSIGVASIRDAAVQLRRIPATMSDAVTVVDVIGELLNATGTLSLPPAAASEAVSVTGWLEMPLDDRPVAIVCDFNDGTIPTSVTSDLFLPGSVRAKLKLNDNDRRYARDAYATQVLLKSRERVCFIVPRRDGEGNPLAPSRLLFRESAAATAERLREMIDKPIVHPPLATRWQAQQVQWAVPVPPAEPMPRPIRAIPVTAFKTYLDCPYRYYLGRQLRLEGVDADREELNAADFGSLLHQTLGAFGRSDLKDETDPDTIAKWLRADLKRRGDAVYSQSPPVAIALQLEQAGYRLARFASQQAQHRRDGWIIDYAEDDEGETDLRSRSFPLGDGRSVLLVGRIDRIDRHPDRGTLVLDYKTSDSGKRPFAAHLPGKSPKPPYEWKDLQLPLYRHLCDEVGGTTAFGYFNLPRNDTNSGVLIADFTDEHFESADDTARRVAARIVDEEFPFDPSRKVSFDDFESVCQTTALRVTVGGAG